MARSRFNSVEAHHTKKRVIRMHYDVEKKDNYIGLRVKVGLNRERMGTIIDFSQNRFEETTFIIEEDNGYKGTSHPIHVTPLYEKTFMTLEKTIVKKLGEMNEKGRYFDVFEFDGVSFTIAHDDKIDDIVMMYNERAKLNNEIT